MCLCFQLKCTSVLATQAKPTEIKLLHPSALILPFLSRDDPKPPLSSTFSSLQDLESSFFLWSVTCLGSIAQVSKQPCRTLPLSRLLTHSCHPARPQPPITRGECAGPARQMPEEKVGQGNPHCGYTEVECGVEGKQEDALGLIPWCDRGDQVLGEEGPQVVSHIWLHFQSHNLSTSDDTG